MIIPEISKALWKQLSKVHDNAYLRLGRLDVKLFLILI